MKARDARPADALMTTYQQAETGYIEALTAIYEPGCLPFFEAVSYTHLDVYKRQSQ